MFGKLLSKPTIQTSPETAASAPRVLVEEAKSDIHVLKESRAAVEAEIEVLARQHDKATESLRELRKKARPGDWHDVNHSYGDSLSRIYPNSALGTGLIEATDRLNQLRTALDEKAAELERVTKLIHAIEREAPGRLRREALEAAMPLVFELIDALCVAAAHEAEYVRLGGPVETSVPWQFALAGGEGIELETVMSRWLKALQQEGIRIPGDISDNSRHLLAPASAYVRTQTDTVHAMHAATCGTRGGINAGFRLGYMSRARTF